MSRYKAYPAYRDSGVEWLGEVPSDWDCVRLKFASELSGVKVAPSNAERYVGLENVQSNSGKFISTEEITPEGMSNAFSCGDVLFGKLRPYLAKSWLADFSGICSSEFLVLTSRKVDAKFLHYFTLTEEFIEQVDSSTYGSKMPRASWDFIGLLDIPVPPHESKKIAEFLDHETAKIDALIEKQQRLIELLKEKRQAVISHAVTKGLNPNAPMKDSGVEWLGDVPAHWAIRKFGFISMVVRGGSPRPAGDPALFNGDYSPWVTVAEITKDDNIYLTETETFLTKKGSEQCRVFSKGTLLLSNSGATLGVPKILSIDANANDGVVGFEDLTLNHEFAYFYLSTLTDDLRERIKQGSGQPNLNTDIVKAITVPVPPDQEVEAIVESIKKSREQFNALVEKAKRGIELLQERRTALISAAVTGKIDVRNWQAAA